MCSEGRNGSNKSGVTNFLQNIFKHSFSADLAIDLGTANTLIYIKNRGIVFSAPSLIAVEENRKKLRALGKEAKDMQGRTPASVQCIRPVKDGVIADFEMTQLMLKHMIKKVMPKHIISKPRVIISVLSGITQVEKRAVIDVALAAGARKVHLVDEPMAAALGMDLPVDRTVGTLIVDIGGGTTDIAVISGKETVCSHSVRVAGDVMDEAIQKQIQRNFDLQIGIAEAERIKINIGSALPPEKQKDIPVFGRDLIRCLPQKIDVTNSLVYEALEEPLNAITAAVITVLEKTDSKMIQDIVKSGIYLTGGCAQIKGLPERLFQEIGIKFVTPADPLTSVVKGVGKVVDNFKEFKVYCVA